MSAVLQSITPRPQQDDLGALRTEIQRVFAAQQAQAIRLRSSSAAERIAKIRKLLDMVEANRQDIYRACYQDFRKPETEVDIGELAATFSEGKHAIGSLRKWMKPLRVFPTKMMGGTFSHVRYEPKGVTLIIAPWNYPVNLVLCPLISALAAGCTAIIKPSELTPHVSALLKKMLQATFDEADVAVFEGDAPVTTALLEQPFDHIFFTGSPAVGKIVMSAAAKHLTSVTLELGGKSPVFVDKTANIKNAARSVAFGKFANNGQTCIAPDYLYIDSAVKDEFIRELKQAVVDSYGDETSQGSTPDYCRIVNSRHHARVKALIDDAKANGARVEFGGVTRSEDNYIAPTAMTGLTNGMKIMSEEIFGPVLPIVEYTDVQTAIDHVNANPKPLALYVYSRNNQFINRVIGSTSAGGTCINTCMVQYLHGNLPFGGVNNSGIGNAHGLWGFKAFSHERAVVRDYFAATLLMAPPFNKFVRFVVKLTLRILT